MGDIVLIKNPKVVLNKFLKGLVYTAIVSILTILLNAITGGGLPAWEIILTTLAYDLLVCLKKGLEEYKPGYAMEFKWFWEPALNAIMTKVKA